MFEKPLSAAASHELLGCIPPRRKRNASQALTLLLQHVFNQGENSEDFAMMLIMGVPVIMMLTAVVMVMTGPSYLQPYISHAGTCLCSWYHG